jgi:L-lysine 2,3-aminomutase
MHCRFCFRRQGVVGGALSQKDVRGAVAYIREHPEIDELVLSGADSFMLPLEALRRLLLSIGRIAHVRTVRFHTRVPVADPARVSASTVRVLREFMPRFRMVVAIHANCAEELTAEVPGVLARFSRAGVTLLNQSVLLRGINDTVEAQERLCRALFAHGVLPYYLHQLDRVAGAWHFEVDQESGLRLIAQLRARLPGYLVPRYVREEPGAAAKTPLG